MKGISKLITIAYILSSIGCGTSNHFEKTGEVNGYKANAWVNNSGRHVSLVDTTGIFLSAVDCGREGIDGRFDEINLRCLPKGHPLEKYANLNSLETIYQKIVEK